VTRIHVEIPKPVVAMYRKRRKDKEVTSSPGGSGSPTGVNTDVDNRPYLDDDFTQERIIDVDLLPLVLPPYGVDYNEWLATHSLYSTPFLSVDGPSTRVVETGLNSVHFISYTIGLTFDFLIMQPFRR